jgi:glycyl-tRNA synthetase (class II)
MTTEILVSDTDARTKSVRRHFVVVDFETLEDGQVTVRNRDTTEQERISIDKLLEYVG